MFCIVAEFIDCGCGGCEGDQGPQETSYGRFGPFMSARDAEMVVVGLSERPNCTSAVIEQVKSYAQIRGIDKSSKEKDI